MTIVEKAAYLKGLTAGLGVEPDSREGKLWGALSDLLSDMAHEIEDLQSGSLDFADTLDEMCEDLSYLEEMVDAYNVPDHGWDDEDEFFEDEDGEAEIDGVLYDATCPSCGEEITFDEETREKGSIRCPNCGEELEFDLGDEGEDED